MSESMHTGGRVYIAALPKRIVHYCYSFLPFARMTLPSAYLLIPKASTNPAGSSQHAHRDTVLGMRAYRFRGDKAAALKHFSRAHLVLGTGEQSLSGGLCSLQSARETVCARDTLDTVHRVDVLDQSDLVAGGGALAGDDGRVGKEELPDLCCERGQSVQMHLATYQEKGRKLTRNHRMPYLAMTLSLLPIQLRYQRQMVAE